MLPSDTSLPAALERRGISPRKPEHRTEQGQCSEVIEGEDGCWRRGIDNVHAGHGARTQHLRDELARAGRRRASFTTR